MLDPHLVSQITAFLSVIMIDIVLAGDNAVVVGSAAAGLPRREQRQVIAVGAALALVARVAFALIAVDLLAIIGLMLAGGLLLLWVAWKMWREIRERSIELQPAASDTEVRGTASKSFGAAVLRVAVADISMSLDNVLAVAGAARAHPWIMVFGLVLSITLMAVAASYIARLIERHHWIAYIGLALVLYVALDMIWEGGREVFVVAAAAGSML